MILVINPPADRADSLLDLVRSFRCLEYLYQNKALPNNIRLINYAFDLLYNVLTKGAGDSED